MYPFIKGLADFWEAYVTWDEAGDRYVIEDDAVHELTAGDFNPIVSLALVRNTIDVALEMSTALGVDEDRHEQWNHLLDHLSEFPTMSRNGTTVFRLAERGTDWVDTNTVATQHIYPGEAIGPDSPDELLEIARNTIEQKAAWDDGNGTNSFFPAAVRVGYDADTILEFLSEYVDGGWPNGFRADNPHGIENTSTVPNTVNEMLLSSHGHVLRLFPVWPDEQPARFEHLRSWGAFLVSSSRSAEGVEFVRIESEQGRPVTMVNPWPGETVVLHRDDGAEESLSERGLSSRPTTGRPCCSGRRACRSRSSSSGSPSANSSPTSGAERHPQPSPALSSIEMSEGRRRLRSLSSLRRSSSSSILPAAVAARRAALRCRTASR
ncbi:MAG: hypothetical protein R2704_11980 [Microthrixaceae bacterium]